MVPNHDKETQPFFFADPGSEAGRDGQHQAEKWKDLAVPPYLDPRAIENSLKKTPKKRPHQSGKGVVPGARLTSNHGCFGNRLNGSGVWNSMLWPLGLKGERPQSLPRWFGGVRKPSAF